jgi:NADH:ubiquinone oxidoreductase subunit F (NADH-binding)
MSLTRWWRKKKSGLRSWRGFPAGMKWSFIDKKSENHVI